MKYFIPVWVKEIIKSILAKKLYTCPICKRKLSLFKRVDDYYLLSLDKYEFVHSPFQFETFNFFNYSCPKCDSSDRNRLYAIFLEKRFHEMALNEKTYSFLDIAPNKSLANWIKKHSILQYRSMDLYEENVDDKADITNMSIYKENSFDIILCSHVLEHVHNDFKAMQELYRILKNGGFAIVMVPVLLTLTEDLDNTEWNSEAERWKYFGQDDHVRIYSKTGFVNKLKQTGFKVNQYGIDYFGANVFNKNGINKRSVLYVLEK